MTTASAPPALIAFGDNSTLLWGMTNAERLRRLARAEGLPERTDATGAHLYANLAYVFDPLWLRHILTLPDTMVVDGGEPVLAYLTGGRTPEAAAQDNRVRIIEYRDNPQIYNRQLRKLDCPFIERLTPETRRQIDIKKQN